jgi:hypothetical protein
MHDRTKDYPQPLGLGYQRHQRYSIMALTEASENSKTFYDGYDDDGIYKDTHLPYI